MGMVLRVHHGTLAVDRAVKLVLGEMRGEARERFQREIDHLARIQHENVVRIHHSGVDERGRAWFAMDLIEGTPLDGVLAKGRLPFDRALALAVGVCRGLGALHAAGIIHRDMKPQNVVVTAEDERPVVIDLGLAVAPELDQRLTATGTVMGTINYMSPEQVDGERATPRSDVWAAGLIAFELLTGERAVEPAGSVTELARNILDEDRPLPSSVDPDLPAALDDVLGRALSRDASRRQADANQLGDELEGLLGSGGPSRRAVRRLRASVIAAVLLVAAIAAAVAVRRGGRETPPAPGPATDPGPVATPALDPAQVERRREAASRELEKIEAEEEQARIALLDGWLAANPEHPRAAAARDRRGELVRKRAWRILDHEGARGTAWLAPDRLLTWSLETIKLWDPGAEKELRVWTRPGFSGVAPIPGREGRFLVVSPDGALAEGRADAPDFEPLPRVPVDGLGRFGAGYVEVDPQGRRFVCAGGTQVLLFALERKADDGPLLTLETGSPLSQVRFSQDGRWILSSSGASLDPSQESFVDVKQVASVWDAEKASTEPSFRVTSFAIPNGMALSRQGLLALAVDGPNVRLYDLGGERGRVLDPDSDFKRLQGAGRERSGGMSEMGGAHGRNTLELAFTPDGKYLVTTAGDRDRGTPNSEGRSELAVWEAATGRLLGSVTERPEVPRGLSLDPTGTRAALAWGRRGLEVWDVTAWGE